MTEQAEKQTEEVVVVKKVRKERQTFSLDEWDDEKEAHKHIRSNFYDHMPQRLASLDGIKTRKVTTKNDDGTHTLKVVWAHDEIRTTKSGAKEVVTVFDDESDYVAITYDPQRKFKTQGRKPRRNTNDKNKRGDKNDTKMAHHRKAVEKTERWN